MRVRDVWMLVALYLCVAGCTTTHGKETPWSGPQEFEIDPVHSSMTFEIDHLGTTRFSGRFNTISGELTMDHTDSSRCRIRVTVDARSLDTHNEKRDGHLKGEQFFNVQAFPTITFVSSHFDSVGTGAWDVTGVLTLRGQSRPVTAQVRYIGSSAVESFGPRSGYQATFSILRSEYGMTTYVENGWLGDEVELTVNIEAQHR